MKIHQLNRAGAANPYMKQQAVSHTGKSGPRTGRKDEVSISTAAKELAAADPARQLRIDELKGAVADGTYKVDARLLADKMARYFQ